MKSFSVLLKGDISSDLTYNIGLIETFLDGYWEMCITSVAFTYEEVTTPAILQIQCNFVSCIYVNQEQQVSAGQRVLNIVIFGGKAVGTKIVIGMKQHDFCEVDKPQPVLRLSFKTVEDNTYIRGAKAVVLAVFRRLR